MSTSAASRKPVALFTSAWSLLTALGLLLMGNGLLGSLVGIRAELEGFDTVVTGLVLAFYFIGFVAGSQLAPVAVTRVGHVRVFAGLAAIAAAATLVHAVAVHPLSWLAVRAAVGASLAGLYVVAESWLNAIGTNQTRGRLLSIYMVVVMGGIGIGQLLLSVADPEGDRLFMLAAVLMASSIVPLTLSNGPAPRFDLPSRMRFGELWTKSPVGIAGGFGAGVANGALFAMAPVYGISVGMSVGRVSMLMGFTILGSVTLQWPIGAWSDRVHRRRAIIVVNVAAASAALALTQISPDSPWLLVAVFVLGGSTFPVYSLSLSHVNDLLEPIQTVAASAVFVLVWGVGSTIGPIAAALLMASTDGTGLFWVVAATHLLLAAFAALRVVKRKGLDVASQKNYLPIPARASGLIGVLARGRRGN